MGHRCVASLSALALVTLPLVPLAGQAPAAVMPATAGTWTPPRTPWGDPDLQGVYTNKADSNTPFERPRELGERQVLTDEEFSKWNVLSYFLRGPLSGYEQGSRSRLTSLVVDPPDGRIPPLTREAEKRGAGRAPTGEDDLRGGRADSWLDRSLPERCITHGLPGSMLPGGDGNEYQILQTPGYVVIRYERDHEARTIPLDGRPHLGPTIRPYMGDSRGHWEGNALVVDVTNFNDKTNFRGSRENLHLIERFTRVDADTLNWAVTAEDPTTWTRPWTFRVPMTSRDDEGIHGGAQVPSKIWVFEYECHEGNYGMIHLLSAARNLDRAAEEATKRNAKRKN